MPRGIRFTKTDVDGLTWYASLFEIMNDRHMEDTPAGVRLVHPDHPDRFPYATNSITDAMGFSNTTRGWRDYLEPCPYFRRSETYRVDADTVTVERPAEPKPQGLGRPVVVWCSTPAVVEVRAKLHADIDARISAGRKL